MFTQYLSLVIGLFKQSHLQITQMLKTTKETLIMVESRCKANIFQLNLHPLLSRFDLVRHDVIRPGQTHFGVATKTIQMLQKSFNP